MHARYWILLPLVAALGCGGKYAPVSGVVTLNGAPLADAYITFQPIGGANQEPGPGSYGKTDAQGRFTLRVVGDDRGGALPGAHTVSISAYTGQIPEPTEERIRKVDNLVPERYNGETTLRFEVPPSGTGAANFDLTSP